MSTMQTNLLLPNPERTSIKRVLLAPGIVLVVLVAVFLGGIMWMGARAFSGTRLFHQTKTGWQQIPPALGLPLTLQVSSNGALWVHTAGMAAMSCWDGKAWKYYTRTNLGIKSGYINPDFVLDGEQVWAPTTEGMLHWDGQRWRLFKEAPANLGASTVAADGQVWVADYTGTLSHFQSGQWQNHGLELPGVNWEANRDVKGSPRLARTPNGVLWLTWHGPWTLDGSKGSPSINREN